MLFINTRPSDRAANLTQALQTAQIPVIELPLLELVQQPYTDELASLFRGSYPSKTDCRRESDRCPNWHAIFAAGRPIIA